MNNDGQGQRSLTVIKWLTFFMFMMFAMTTDSVGVIIPEVIKEFRLSMTVAGAFHYATMAGIAFAGIFLGYLADKLGRKKTIILGLVLFALNSYLFSVGKSFHFFLVLLVISGTAIGIFKTGALALIGDITRSTTEHTATMNTVEGLLCRRRDHRTCHCRPPPGGGYVMEVALCHCRDNLRCPHCHRFVCQIPADHKNRRTTD